MTILRFSTAKVILPIVLLAGLGSAFGQTRHDFSITMTDASPPDSPIRVSAGAISFSEELYPERVRTKWSFHVELMNASPKTIVAYQFSIDLNPDHGSGVHYENQNDDFFNNEFSFLPNSQVSLRDESPGWTEIRSNSVTNPSLVKVPRAVFKIMFVDFQDGTHYGTSVWGSNLTAGRSGEIVRLDELLQAYQGGGYDALLTTMAKSMNRPEDPPYTWNALAKLKRSLQNESIGEFVIEITDKLRVGRQRASTM